jgi:hypothetical protein
MIITGSTLLAFLDGNQPAKNVVMSEKTIPIM